MYYLYVWCPDRRGWNLVGQYPTREAAEPIVDDYRRRGFLTRLKSEE